MSTLALQQQALLDALFAWPAAEATQDLAAHVSAPSARGLKVYQANGHALAERALQAAYPVLAQLLGDESLCALARAFWHEQPPLRGDLAQWGDGLARFVASSAQLADEPYLADVASVEWALHRCANAADQGADPASLALLLHHDPNALQLMLAPGCLVLASDWPVASILGAHRDLVPDFAEVGQRLRGGVAEAALVWRARLQPCVRAARAGEADFVQAVLAGRPLDQALDSAPALDFNAWLPNAVQSGLLLGARLVAPTPVTTDPQSDESKS